MGPEIETAFSVVDIRPHLNLIGATLFPFEVRVLSVIRRSNDAKAPHLVEEGSAVYTKSCGGSSRPAQFPVGAHARSENFLTNLVFKGCICHLGLQRLAAFEWRRFKNAIVRKDHPARNVVLQLSNVPRPAVAN